MKSIKIKYSFIVDMDNEVHPNNIDTGNIFIELVKKADLISRIEEVMRDPAKAIDFKFPPSPEKNVNVDALKYSVITKDTFYHDGALDSILFANNVKAFTTTLDFPLTVPNEQNDINVHMLGSELVITDHEFTLAANDNTTRDVICNKLLHAIQTSVGSISELMEKDLKVVYGSASYLGRAFMMTVDGDYKSTKRHFCVPSHFLYNTDVFTHISFVKQTDIIDDVSVTTQNMAIKILRSRLYSSDVVVTFPITDEFLNLEKEIAQ